jgi:hypothetical protein
MHLPWVTIYALLHLNSLPGLPLRENDPMKPALGVHRIAYCGVVAQADSEQKMRS